jgi:hypothetical protein
MRRSFPCLFIVAAFAAACDSTGPLGPATDISSNSDVVASATVGAMVPVSMKVTDAHGRAIANARVKFVPTAGDGSVSPQVVVTDGSGVASTQFTLGQTAGTNTLTASIDLVADSERVDVIGVPGAAAAELVFPHNLRIQPGVTTGTIVFASVDQYGNKIAGGPAALVVVRDGSVVSVDPSTGTVTVGSTAGSTYVVVSGGGGKDSSLVTVLTTGDPPCAGVSTKASLAVGEVMTTGFVDNTVCVAATASNAEYAIVPYFDSPLPSGQANIAASAFGIRTPGGLGDVRKNGTRLTADISADRNSTGQSVLENRLFDLSEHELPGRAPMARRWYTQHMASGMASLAVAPPAVGSRMQLNVNSIDYCTNADNRTGRVVAVTTHAIVVVDSGAWTPFALTDAEYAAYGAAFDTISYPLDVANFGEPTDIDNNGRVIIFFTHGVNEAGPDGEVLGFFFGRDLLPKVGEFGSCPGSNVGEVINMQVPDAIVPRSYVQLHTVETMSHEFQHLINGARRLYINTGAAVNEERWLNEGLSHIAEELTFYRVSGLQPRQNLGSISIQASATAQAFNFYAADNFARLRSYLGDPDVQAPVGVDDNDDDFDTRGAIWSYLRYVADQRFPQNESTLWGKLVNSNSTGLQNLYESVGTDARSLMRDWTLAIYLDDLTAGINAKYQMPSWNYRQIMSPYGPKTINLVDKTSVGITLNAGGTIFARFGTNANSDAFVSVQGTGSSPLPPHMLLALVRTK